ncbi:DUF4065 domain-containing protein [Faecalicatena sp. AGMB00832]|uniref:DUF4065 domain-containing protein n=1 Tax=Faecalicatena faecalis TaxID=2726362 RepID=A0ABS6D4T9_9FIRM|nr:DUF4065 domain-containing protein [Faecalicatena faecalis]
MKNDKERSGKMDKMLLCFECGNLSNYNLRETIRKYEGEGYQFEMLVKIPFCDVCGAPIYDEETENEIAKLANEKIREQREIVSKKDIIEILDTYSVSQKFLSRLLGWGEITLTRYVGGNYTPNKSNSDKLKELKNPYMFKKLLEDNLRDTEERKEEKSFKKASCKVHKELEKLEESKGKIFKVVNWFLAQSSDEAPITHLALQKLLYFTQCWSIALDGKGIFEDDCQAWVHGAVYPRVYEVFKQFKYMPLPRVEEVEHFKDNELIILNAVKTYYYDVYNAKALEDICHREEPYKKARKGYQEGEMCQEIIGKDSIQEYYGRILKDYNIQMTDISKIKNYLNALLK